ncbi:hypothetical protein BGC31_14850 [Komagataeibacter xylinus]|nr:Hypothetical protein H845_1158 [Komagataeibacter xylinus E25]RFP01767.1 hypothetical protein BGC31_14850 [Komagataeibacter xylinus]RFP05866.1 hypothetical protein BFX83_12975 [Komagataeibacter xylinus]
MSFQAAIITMVYNESYFLPLWCGYYGRQLGMENLYVIDHSSTDHSTTDLPCNRMRIPRSCFDDAQRAQMISKLHESLLSFFDVVIYVDCDEFLVARPDKFPSLRSYLEQRRDHPVIRAVGIDVFQERMTMPPVDPSLPLLAQRSFGIITPWESKPLVSSLPVTWSPGFHECSRASYLDQDLWLFHMKNMDLEVSLTRLALTRSLNWSEISLQSGQGQHQRCSDEELKDKFRQLINNKTDTDLASLPIGDFLTQAKASRLSKIPDTFKIF